MYEAYKSIFDRCGLKYRIVEADTGVMGGSKSQEFQVPCEVGESDVVYTESGGYAVVRAGAVALRDASTAAVGDRVEIELSTGALGARVEDVRP